MDQETMPDQAKYRSPDGCVICACCGRLIKDSKEENTAFGEDPYPQDDGVGRCFRCFGDPNAKSFRKKLGWAGQMFFDARIKIVWEHLNRNRARFDALPYEQKVEVVRRLIERGTLI